MENKAEFERLFALASEDRGNFAYDFGEECIHVAHLLSTLHGNSDDDNLGKVALLDCGWVSLGAQDLLQSIQQIKHQSGDDDELADALWTEHVEPRLAEYRANIAPVIFELVRVYHSFSGDWDALDDLACRGLGSIGQQASALYMASIKASAND